jgi:exodeoxyribonuclease VII small subunit
MTELVPGQDLSFEDALAQLEALVAQLETGQLSLSDAVGSYERGMGLAAYCTDLLGSAELRIRQVEVLVEEADAQAADTVEEADFDLDEEIGRLLG